MYWFACHELWITHTITLDKFINDAINLWGKPPKRWSEQMLTPGRLILDRKNSGANKGLNTLRVYMWKIKEFPWIYSYWENPDGDQWDGSAAVALAAIVDNLNSISVSPIWRFRSSGDAVSVLNYWAICPGL